MPTPITKPTISARASLSAIALFGAATSFRTTISFTLRSVRCAIPLHTCLKLLLFASLDGSNCLERQKIATARLKNRSKRRLIICPD